MKTPMVVALSAAKLPFRWGFQGPKGDLAV
jgi:hypothetical protein